MLRQDLLAAVPKAWLTFGKLTATFDGQRDGEDASAAVLQASGRGEHAG